MNKRNVCLIFLVLAGFAAITGCSNQAEASRLEVRIISPATGESLGGSIEFNAEVSGGEGSGQDVLWDFGDGASGSGLQTTHQYGASGDYRARVSVTDEKGQKASAEVQVSVALGPKAVATVRRDDKASEAGTLFLSDEAPLRVAFSSRSSKAAPGGEIVSYHWNFGDGNESSEPNPTYVYNGLGEYQVMLTVEDREGRASTANVTVRVISYEPIQGSLDLAGGPVSFELYSKNARSLSTGFLIFLQYVVHTERRLSEDEIGEIFADIIEKARQRPRVERISMQLFDSVKNEFMVPREYAHYLGAALWDRLEAEVGMTFNGRYLDGTAEPVVSYGISENMLLPGDVDCGELCDRFRIGLVDIYIEEDGVCKGDLDFTFREIAQWRLGAAFDGYLVTIHPWDLSKPIAWAIGARPTGPSLQELPLRFFSQPPSSWNDKTDANLWIFYEPLPACSESP